MKDRYGNEWVFVPAALTQEMAIGAMPESHYAFAQRYQQPIESAPEVVREAFESAWVMSRAVAIADSARVCKTWKEICAAQRRHGAACGAQECMKLVAIQDED